MGVSYGRQTQKLNLPAMHTHPLKAIPNTRAVRIEVCEKPHDPT